MRELQYTRSFNTEEHETVGELLREISEWWSDFNAERRFEAGLVSINFGYLSDEDHLYAVVTVEDC